MKTKITFIYIVLILFWSGKSFAQNNIIIKTTIDSTLIGYNIPLEINLRGVRADSFKIECLNFLQVAKAYFSKMDTSLANQLIKQKAFDQDLPATDFEISDFGKWNGKGNTIFTKGVENNKIKIKIWDEGQFIILPAIIVQNDTIFPENPDNYPQITVLSGIAQTDSLKNIAPIKEIIREEKNWKDYMWIYIVFGVIVLIGVILWFLPKIIGRKEGKSIEKKSAPIVRPAHEISLEKLHKLQKEKIWKQGRVKEFQSELTYILREYLENRYNINALEQTTGEIVDSLQKIKIKTEDIEIIKNILQIADMVKFAKAKPEEDINQKFLDDTIDFVERTKEIPLQNNISG